jgi:hypothetical protein
MTIADRGGTVSANHQRIIGRYVGLTGGVIGNIGRKSA